ncbi:MAG: hypothetical protein ACI4DP_13655 [Candidatus Ornithomonoglobus sp.]
MSKKKMTACVALLTVFFSTGTCFNFASAETVSAADTDSADVGEIGSISSLEDGFNYYIDGTDVVIADSDAVELNNDKDVNVILAVYDSGRLLNTVIKTVPAGTVEYSADNLKIHLSDTPENPSVKLFVWSADGSITPQAEAREPERLGSVSFKANDVADDDSAIGTAYVEFGKIPVYKSAQSSSTVKYTLSADNSGKLNTVMYVNGYSAGIVTNELIDTYILNNTNGIVTLIDYDGDNKYDRINVSYTVDAIVDSAELIDGKVIINLLAGPSGASISWGADNAGVKLIKNGEEISYTELNTCDVLTVSYDVVNSGREITELDSAEIYVSDETVSGAVTSRDTLDYIIRIGGTDYEVNGDMADIAAIDLSEYYIAYLNIYGQVVYFEKDDSNTNYGVIVSMYQVAGNDYPTVRLITANGEVVAYECKDDAEASKFYNYATGEDGYGGYGGYSFTKSMIRDRIINGQTVCTYKLSSGKIKFDMALSGSGGTALEYQASSANLGSYTISDSTKLIGIGEYMSETNAGNTVYKINSSNFTDGETYDVYLFNRGSRGDYRFAIVLGGELVNLPEPDPETEITGIGVIVAMYQSAGDDYPTVRLITDDGEVAAYECKDASEADKFYNYATGETGYGGYSFTKSMIRDRIISGQTVCNYSVSGGRIKLESAMPGFGGADLEYKASSAELGSYAISDTAKLIDMSDYMSETNAGLKAYPVSLSELEDGMAYDVYAFDSDDDGSCDFAVIFGGMLSLNTAADAAVIKSVDGVIDFDGTVCTQLTVLKDSEEKTVFIGGEDYVSDGEIIVYKEGRDGYVEDGDLYSYITNTYFYPELYYNTISSDNFAETLRNVNIIENGDYAGAAEPAFASPTVKNVALYFGPVYAKRDGSIQIITGKQDGISDISSDTVSLEIGENVNSYMYDYTNRPGYRASVSELPEVSPELYDAVSSGGSIDWSEAEAIEPVMAFAKVVDGELTELVGYYPASELSEDAEIEPGTVMTIKASDVADDNAYIGTAYVENMKIPVYASEESCATMNYPISEDCKIIINGAEIGAVSNDLIDRYILCNQNGEMTLSDTDNDSVFDEISVKYYVAAVVDSVITSSTGARIYFKASDNAGSSMKWDPDDEDIDITFTKDGSEISYTDLAENDVLSIAVNVIDAGLNGRLDLNDLEYYDILVSSNQVSGTLSSRNTEDWTVNVGGTEYAVVETLVSITDMELCTDYTLYLDAFGYIAWYDEGSVNKNYGVIVAMYQSAGNDYPTVRLITDSGEVVAYECRDSYEAERFYEYATGEYGYGSYSFTKAAIRDRILSGQTVCTYNLSGGKIKFDREMPGMGGSGLEYNALSSKLGPYSINASTKIMDMDAYMSGSDTVVHTLTPDDFENEAEYNVYLFDKNIDGVYRFAIVFSGINLLRAESPMAVVQKIVGTTDIDGVTCTEALVSYSGQSDISVMFEGYGDDLSEGSVVAYAVGRDGYVEDGNYHTVFSPSSDYASLLANSLSSDVFGSRMLKNVNQISSGTYAGGFEPSYAVSYTKDVVFYYGIVYSKSGNSLELFTTQDSGMSNVADVKSFSVSSANSYVYDYGQKAKYRVSIGSQTQSTSVFNPVYTDNSKNFISWERAAAEDVAPAIAIVKVADGDVIDVIYYAAP